MNPRSHAAPPLRSSAWGTSARRIPALRVLALALILASIRSGARPAALGAQSDPLRDRYARMTPEERVGQVFLVAVYGGGDPPLADAEQLIRDHRLGGVVLQKGNAVFSNARGVDLPRAIAETTGILQAAAMGDGGVGVPLFIAVDHEGNGDPLTHLREGFSALPSPMAIGATWDPEAARAVGDLVGRELSAVGVNVVLGPVLDVLADPRVDTGGDIGTRAFGGHPYWVARMGRAYIEGIHAGGAGRVATVAKHFPGHGGSDRLPDNEIATVNKSLSELRRIELPPFAAVTVPGGPATTDALMTSHIRYRGFQGNIQDATAPISFDPEGMGDLLGLAGYAFGPWREAGGLVVSDSLGVRAVKRYFDETLRQFPNRDIARRALMAGNDVLTLAEFGIPVAWSNQRPTIVDTLSYFAEQYRRDRAFQARIDEAALRVLKLKAALYPDWRIDAVRADPQGVAARVGTTEAREAVVRIVRQGVTILRRAAHPQRGDRIVVVTEDPPNPANPARRALACPDELCGLDAAQWEALKSLGPTWVESFIVDGFGPRGTGIIDPGAVSSLTFCQLEAALSPESLATETPAPDGGAPEAGGDSAGGDSSAAETSTAAAQGASAGTGPVAGACMPPVDRPAAQAALEQADWIVFGIGALDPSEITKLNGFFLDQVDKLTEAHLAVLSFGPPYYIHATNLARLDAYIAAYTKIPPAAEAAVNLLFNGAEGAREREPHPPVSVEDAGYDLTEALEPDPDQPIGLTLDAPKDPGAASLPARITVGIQPILDRNGNPVPDGTVVELTSDPPGALAGSPVRMETAGGAAQAELVFPLGGRVRILASTTTGGAVAKDPLIVELPNPTATPPPTPTDPPPAGGPSAHSAARRPDTPDSTPPGPLDLLLALVAIAFAGLAPAAAPAWRRRGPGAQVRGALLAIAGGLAAYVVFGGAQRWLAGTPAAWPLSSALAAASGLGGGLAGLAAGWWSRGRLTRTSAPERPA